MSRPSLEPVLETIDDICKLLDLIGAVAEAGTAEVDAIRVELVEAGAIEDE